MGENMINSPNSSSAMQKLRVSKLKVQICENNINFFGTFLKNYFWQFEN